MTTNDDQLLEARALELLSQMTLAEKVANLSGSTPFWAGLALERQLISSYTCIYPDWHESVRVTEGFDLKRSREELPARFLGLNINLTRGNLNLEIDDVQAVLLVQSPAWTNPFFDSIFLELCQKLNAQIITPPLERHFLRDSKSSG